MEARIRDLAAPGSQQEKVRRVVRIRLPGAVRVKKGFLKGGVRLWSDEVRLKTSRPKFDRDTRVILFQERNPYPTAATDLRFKIKRGYLRRIPLGRLGSSIRFGFELAQTGIEYEDFDFRENLAEYERTGRTEAYVRLPRKSKAGR